LEKHNVKPADTARPGATSATKKAAQLTERHPPVGLYSVVLLDEIEKAHPDVFNMLLQIMKKAG